MNKLKEEHGDKLEVLQFPCHQFGWQEWFGGPEIPNSLKHVRPGNGFETKGILMEKCEVNGAKAHPIFQRLRAVLPERNTSFEYEFQNPMGTQHNSGFRSASHTPVHPTDAIWNFEFWLIAPDGTPFKRYHPHPEQHEKQITEDLQQLLA
mmetsp:Transcript_19506/g.49258  ORF Transcript_19506/g.49258 Transcript_19506/m.49258 type:complete len:150 (+) Transcript_19506:315-764(+)